MNSAPIRVVIADDQPAMRNALRIIVEAGAMLVVGDASDGNEALLTCMRERPDVVLMDIRMPGRDGLSATAELTRSLPATRVIVLTTFDDDASLFGALRSGATGFLLKNTPPEDLQAAVLRAAVGDAVLDPTVLARVMREAAKSNHPVPDNNDIGSLTEREKDVLWLVAQGHTNSEIARRLGISHATAKTHVSSVITKLGVRDRVQAAIHAHHNGLASEARTVATRNLSNAPTEQQRNQT
jgi:DNA-binding NarL/FixJ family response regulator